MNKSILLVISFLFLIFQSCQPEYNKICADYSLPIKKCKEATQTYFKSIPKDKIKYNTCLPPGVVNRSANYMELSEENMNEFFHQNFDEKKVDFIIIRYSKANKSYYILSSFEKYCTKYRNLGCKETHSYVQPKYGFSYFKNSCHIQGLELQEFLNKDESYSLTIYFTELVGK